MKFRDYLKESSSFNVGDWVHQPQNEYENTYALVIGKTKRGKTEVIKIQDWRPIAAKTTLDNWYPQPKKIDPKKVPNKLKQKVEKKRQQLGEALDRKSYNAFDKLAIKHNAIEWDFSKEFGLMGWFKDNLAANSFARECEYMGLKMKVGRHTGPPTHFKGTWVAMQRDMA